MAAYGNTRTEAAKVAATQTLWWVAFQVIPAAAVLFGIVGLEGTVRARLGWAHLYAVAPWGVAGALFVAAAWASLARTAHRMTPAASSRGEITSAAGLRLRAYPAVAALTAFVSGAAAYVTCALGVGLGRGGEVVWGVGTAAAVAYAVVSYAAAERNLASIYAYLTAQRVKLARRRYFPVELRGAVAAALGAAVIMVLFGAGSLWGEGVGWSWGQWLVAAVLVAGAGAAAYVVFGRFAAPLQAAARGRPITYYFGDEVEGLTAACRKYVEETRRFDETVQRVTEELSGQASRVRESLTEQASIASEQASAISETSVTMKELAGTVKQTASRAEDISGRVDDSVKLVKTAEDQILTNVERIEALAEEAQNAAKLSVALNESARRMDEIVALVNDLAEQSTVLALNAAIEAAKAGEFGRGFAAVAREVKNLAASSKEGTEEIRKVLHEIRDGTLKTVTSARESAEQSTVLREGAGRAKSLVEEIVPLVEEIGRMSKQIAASARQQSLGLEQVTTAVDNINDAATEALDQAKAVRGAVEMIMQISSRLAEATEASHWWDAPGE
ncbi:MAG: hypothetical protein JSU81_04400 [Candidatus Coatesbacteria bacterium]|nr:MAG: hypothetical protein JSU81_04400 [Candidatus Coatesbacteria bacterium]